MKMIKRNNLTNLWNIFNDDFILLCTSFQDEKKRIENLGGAVIHWGTWRVNGQLAVSRAIGEYFF